MTNTPLYSGTRQQPRFESGSRQVVLGANEIELYVTLPPLLAPSFRPLFCARRVPLTCSGCSSELKLGPSLRARALSTLAGCYLECRRLAICSKQLRLLRKFTIRIRARQVNSIEACKGAFQTRSSERASFCGAVRFAVEFLPIYTCLGQRRCKAPSETTCPLQPVGSRGRVIKVRILPTMSTACACFRLNLLEALQKVTVTVLPLKRVSNPGSRQVFLGAIEMYRHVTLPPLLTPSFRPLFCARRVPLTCSGCSSDLKLGPSLRARALRVQVPVRANEPLFVERYVLLLSSCRSTLALGSDAARHQVKRHALYRQLQTWFESGSRQVFLGAIEMYLHVTLPPLLTPSFRPLFCARRVPLTCSGCSSDLKLGPSLRAGALSRFRLRPYHFENARSRLISEAKQGRAWLVLGWETAWEYQVLFRLRPYHFENARSRLIADAKQGRAWLVLGWETAWEYQVLRFRLRLYHFENARSRLISEAKEGWSWLVLGWETAWEYQKEREETSRGPQVGLREKYSKELTVEVEVEGTEKIFMMELLKGVKKECGEVIGCRVRGERTYELTMKDEEAKGKLMDGVRIKGVMVHARDILNNDMVVSFINLPVYLEDEKILSKLEEWGVRPMSPIKRRVWPGTDTVDGTRFLKVRFTEQVCSLPYSTKFETLRGTEYFRVIHDRQVRVCRLCIKPGHIFRECPEFKCFKCGKSGHYARDCEERMGIEGAQMDGQDEGERSNNILTEEQGEKTTDDVEWQEMDGAVGGEERNKMEWRDRAESSSEEDGGEEEMEQSGEIEEEEEEKGENNEE
ncbi:unnamed protein product [Leuciscus chuanchicus]